MKPFTNEFMSNCLLIIRVALSRPNVKMFEAPDFADVYR